MNYVLLPVSTNRSEGSIKFSGPKAWADVPKDLKEIAFRNPFSKKIKEHILNNIHAELPHERNSSSDAEDHAYHELEELFQTDDEDSVFYGFSSSQSAHQELELIFQSDDEESIFEGFEISRLSTLFQSEDENEEFLGF